jgi:hypothetical protein
MSHRARSNVPAETPIERIFERVVGRKMTSQERVWFHLKPNTKAPPAGSGNRQSRAA